MKAANLSESKRLELTRPPHGPGDARRSEYDRATACVILRPACSAAMPRRRAHGASAGEAAVEHLRLQPAVWAGRPRESHGALPRAPRRGLLHHNQQRGLLTSSACFRTPVSRARAWSKTRETARALRAFRPPPPSPLRRSCHGALPSHSLVRASPGARPLYGYGQCATANSRGARRNGDQGEGALLMCECCGRCVGVALMGGACVFFDPRAPGSPDAVMPRGKFATVALSSE